MTSSSDLRTERGLDAMLIVYSLLNDHPASLACERFIRNMPGWFTTVLTLLEARAILTKVYSVGGKQASQKLAQFAAGPILVVSVDLATALAATSMADALKY
jgi:predicted nucleic acid-binding protein